MGKGLRAILLGSIPGAGKVSDELHGFIQTMRAAPGQPDRDASEDGSMSALDNSRRVVA
jgi:hypothetical protein